jgi:hypothetical protein
MKAPPCPAGAFNATTGNDDHLYGWDNAISATCTFDKPHPSRPAQPRRRPALLRGAGARDQPGPALQALAGGKARLPGFPADQSQDGGLFAAAELPESLPGPALAAGVASVAALTRASAVASSMVAEAAGKAAQLMRAMDDQVGKGVSFSAPRLQRDQIACINRGPAAAAAASALEARPAVPAQRSSADSPFCQPPNSAGAGRDS